MPVRLWLVSVSVLLSVSLCFCVADRNVAYRRKSSSARIKQSISDFHHSLRQWRRSVINLWRLDVSSLPSRGLAPRGSDQSPLTRDLHGDGDDGNPAESRTPTGSPPLDYATRLSVCLSVCLSLSLSHTILIHIPIAILTKFGRIVSQVNSIA